MKILITGGLGYIGGRIAQYVYEREPESEIFLTTISQRIRPKWLTPFQVIPLDVLRDESVRNCLSKEKYDAIIHLAALNENESAENPELALEVNTRGTYKLLDTARKENIGKFVYFSTFHVYGPISDTVINENTPTRPFHPYAITHRSAEDQVNYFRHYHDFQTLIFRLSNGYGYPMHKEVNRWTLVFNDLCRQAVTKGRITLKSSGKQYRDFISLHDVARAVHHFLFLKNNEWDDGLFNLGGNCLMSIMEVAEKVSEVYRRRYNKKILGIEMKPDNLQPGEVKKIRYSIDKLLKTGFKLAGDMDNEIDKTLELCEQFKN